MASLALAFVISSLLSSGLFSRKGDCESTFCPARRHVHSLWLTVGSTG